MDGDMDKVTASEDEVSEIQLQISSPGQAKKRNKQIEAQIQQDFVRTKTTVKVLLLGGSSSGKTTIFKQMRILHMDGFTSSDYENYRVIIHSNSVIGLHQVLQAAESLGHSFSGDLAVQAREFLSFLQCNREGNHEITREMGGIMQSLWRSQPAQFAWTHRFNFDFLEGTKHFLDQLDVLVKPGYEPTHADILFARFRTTGIYDMAFQYQGLTLQMVDVGGQKSEQKKWIHCFDNVQMLLFVAAMADYDLRMDDDPSESDYDEETHPPSLLPPPPHYKKTTQLQNRLLHNLEIFKTLCGSPYFTKTSFILFLNKKDVFQEKIQKTPLTVCFNSYSGKIMYGHFTKATDTNNVNKVFNDCMHQILHKNITSAGVA